MNKIVLVACIFLLSSCISFQPSIPVDYAGARATFSDSFNNYKGSSAHFYVVTKIDGKPIENSGYRTRINNLNRLFNMTPYMVSRDTTNQEHVFTIAGFVQFATDGQTIFSNSMIVVKEITFKPKTNQLYTIKGELSSNGSDVWIEDKKGNKILAHQPSS
jgi:hypothetical protein